MRDDVLISVENVSKKFCKSLKRSLWYGLADIAAEVTAGGKNRDVLREQEFWAVKDVSFELRRGECIGLIGHNGAGKTTLLKMLNGLIKPNSGRIAIRGRVGALIALGAGFNPVLTGRENIYVNGSVLGLTKKEIEDRIDSIIDFAEIREFIDAPVQSYSSGMAVRLGFAIAVKCQPDILLLDEVLAVGDVGFQAKCYNTLSEFRKQGTAFILVSHNLHQLARYADRILYLKQGKTMHLGDPAIGMEQFTRDMGANDSDEITETSDWSKVDGSGKVIFKRAFFTDESNREVSEIRSGDTVALCIDYECPGEDVSDAVLDIIIRDREGILFQGTSENYGVDFGKLQRRGRLVVKFSRVPVNAPELQFFFALLSRKTAEVYDWKRNVRLKVIHQPKLTGRLALEASWSVVGSNSLETVQR